MFVVKKNKNNIPWVHTPMKCLVRACAHCVR